MKRLFLFALSLCASIYASAADDLVYYPAESFTIIGKLHPDNEKPFQRMDQKAIGAGDKIDKEQMRLSSGLAIAFETDSYKIAVKPFISRSTNIGNTAPISAKGFDMYIKKGKKWIWAGAAASENGKSKEVASGMNGSRYQCLLYLPLLSEIDSLQIGVDRDARISPIENPFKYRIAVYGLSSTHGIGTTRSGMAFPAQLSRLTGFGFLNCGCYYRGNLSPVFAKALAGADVDAYLLDVFNIYSVDEIEKKFPVFIETLQESSPDKPIIVMEMIPRARGHFQHEANILDYDVHTAASAQARKAAAKYKNVFFISCSEDCNPDFEPTSDGTNPGDYGTFLRALSVKDKITEILIQHLQ